MAPSGAVTRGTAKLADGEYKPVGKVPLQRLAWTRSGATGLGRLAPGDRDSRIATALRKAGVHD